MEAKLFSSKIGDYCLETGQKIAFASQVAGGIGQPVPAFGGMSILDKLGFFGTSARELHLRLSIEFVIAIAFLGDTLVILGSLCLGYWMGCHPGAILLSQRHGIHSVVPMASPSLNYLNLLLMGTLFLLGAFAYLHLYSRDCFMRFSRTAKAILLGSCFWLAVYLAFSLIFELQSSISGLAVVLSFVAVSGAMLVWRGLFHNVMCWEAFASNLRQKALFVGWGKEAEQFAQEIRRDRNRPCDIIGYLPLPQSLATSQPPTGVPVLGEYEELQAILEKNRPDIVILADQSMNAG